MSQENGKPKIVPETHSVIVIEQPMVRDYSTGGGHGPEDTLVEGDDRIVTQKWQGYPPVNLNVVGKANAPLPEVAIPRYTGTAQYATRVQFPDMLHCKLLVSPHPRSRIRRLDVSAAEQMPDCEKRHRADFVVPTGLSKRESLRRLFAIVRLMRRWPARRWPARHWPPHGTATPVHPRSTGTR